MLALTAPPLPRPVGYLATGTGLYDNLAAFGLPYAEAIFDIDFFRQTPVCKTGITTRGLPARRTRGKRLTSTCASLS